MKLLQVGSLLRSLLSPTRVALHSRHAGPLALMATLFALAPMAARGQAVAAGSAHAESRAKSTLDLHSASPALPDAPSNLLRDNTLGTLTPDQATKASLFPLTVVDVPAFVCGTPFPNDGPAYSSQTPIIFYQRSV